MQPDQDTSEEGEETPSELYSRIQELSEKIKTDLEAMRSPESMTETVFPTVDSAGAKDLHKADHVDSDDEEEGSCTQQVPSFKPESSRQPSGGSHDATSSSNTDLKLQKAIGKMKKLDAKLADLTKVYMGIHTHIFTYT